jgi:hypothetical protein
LPCVREVIFVHPPGRGFPFSSRRSSAIVGADWSDPFSAGGGDTGNQLLDDEIELDEPSSPPSDRTSSVPIAVSTALASSTSSTPQSTSSSAIVGVCVY